ncbi:MAG: hypothetical protein US61_C0024G0010 [Parcubacteria group bacterium GW2011_GWE2_37_8]|nr:MAG: hypothetical protein US61_C0024G0010 [Parcubacteria group bacterium GW2011_GWE2_37_8]
MKITLSLIHKFSKNWSKLTAFIVGGALVLALIQPVFVSAVAVTIFEDNFNQDNSGMTNGWDEFSNSDDPSRETDSWVRVGLSGRGMRIDGSGSSNPDEGAERDIATKGYATLHISYSRAIDGFESGDQFISQYSLDGGSFTTIETLTADQVHSVNPITIDNANHYTKLILRFYVNGDNGNDRAAVDNVEVTGENPPLFYDGFESDNFTVGGWVTEESPNITTAGDKIWTDNNTSSNGHASEIDGSSGANPDDAIVKSFDTTGYKDIKVRYARRANNLEPYEGDKFRSMYSVNGGAGWAELETILDDTPYATVIFGPIEFADNNPNFQLRFEMNGNNTNNETYIDDVVIWGDPIPPAPTNTPPSFDPISNQTIDEDASSQNVAITNVSPGDESGQTVGSDGNHNGNLRQPNSRS